MISKAEAKQKIRELIEKYERIRAEGKIKQYNEEMTKKDFILPMFRALGWDVENIKMDEVTAEEKVSKGRVDYAFRIDGIPKFFLEAKALREDLNVPKWSEQAINYAWHKNVVWAVLTDFEGIRVFNAEIRSKLLIQNQFFQLPYTKYLEYFDQIWLLSKESFENNRISKEAETVGKKFKKVPIDKQLLSDLTRFRELLSRNILRNNKNLTESDIDESVQRIIDRLIFMRTCEDKEIEAPILKPLIRENKNKKIITKLNESFRYFDDTYNSKLFTPHLCENLIIDDNVIEEIINGLYSTKDCFIHYDFSVIEADVLGNIYEQYLGHILKKKGRGAKLESGKAHRKEQGIYYTPTYVVDYIVRNTVGELAKNKKFDLKNIKVLDPACGSGSFLMKAFDYLVALDKKRNKYAEQTKLDLSGASATYGRKVEILKNNIFGVDLDPKATEIAQLNLLLKAAEKKHRLPTLQENIKVGNSLIDNPEIAGIKSFKWEEEFEKIMENGGFDVVIGNPPYDVLLPSERTEGFSQVLEYLRNEESYGPALGGRTNLFRYFIVRGLNLVKEGGYLGFIVPLSLINDKSTYYLRKWLIDNFQIISINNFPQKDNPNNRVFKDAKLSTCIIILRKSHSKGKFIVNTYPGKDFSDNPKKFKASSKEIITFDFSNYSIPLVSEDEWELLKKLHHSTKFSSFKNFAQSFQGEMNLTVQKKHFTDNPSDLNMLKGVEIGRYKINVVLSQGRKEWFSKNSFKTIQSRFNRISHIQSKRIVLQQISGVDDRHRIRAMIVEENTILANSTNYILPKNDDDIYFFCGLINSKLIDWCFRKSSTNNHVNTYELDSLPIPITISNAHRLNIHENVKKILKISEYIETMFGKQTDEKARLEKEIQKIDNQIDQKVYKIYDLSKEEIKIIEKNLK